MYQIVESKLFLSKLRKVDNVSLQDVLKAVERVLSNPTLNNYKRPYLTPYLQEHPTDKTLTIFFEIIEPNKVFFVWINDESCPHNTHKNFGEDPCIKEFNRQKSLRNIEVYSEDYHTGVFTITPRSNMPTFISFKKFDAKVYSSVLKDDDCFYILAITTLEDENEIFDHYKIFIEKVGHHFKSIGEKFEFRVISNDKDFENLLEQNIDKEKWIKSLSGSDITWSLK